MKRSFPGKMKISDVRIGSFSGIVTDPYISMRAADFQRMEESAACIFCARHQIREKFAHGYEFDFGTKESSWQKFEVRQGNRVAKDAEKNMASFAARGFCVLFCD